MSPTHTKENGLSRQAWTSLVVFAALLVVVIATRQDRVRVGIRELSLPQLVSSDITKIEIAGKHQALLVKAGDAWTVADPAKPDVTFPAEKAPIERTLAELTAIDVGTYVSGRTEKHDDLEVTVEKGTIVRATTSKGTTLRIVLGRFAKGGGNYVRLEDAPEVFVAKGNLAAQVRKDVEAWRDKKVIDAPADAIAELTVKTSDGAGYTVVHEKSGEGADAKDTWKLKDGTPVDAGFRVDSESLGRLARSVGSLRAAGFVDDADKVKALAFDAGVIEMVLTGGEKKTLTFAAVDADKKGAVRLEGNPQVFSLTEFTEKALLKPLVEHRDLSLFPTVAIDDVNEVRFIGTNLRATLKNDGAAWSYDGPGAELVDAAGIPPKLSGVLKLKAAKVVGAESDVKATFKDELKIEVVLKDGSTRVARLGGDVPSVDDKPATEVYATSGDGLVYAIGKFQKTRHEKPAELFKATERPPQDGMGGMGGGGIPGLESLPPEIRKQLEAQLKAQGR
jgi:hypothetical protein